MSEGAQDVEKLRKLVERVRFNAKGDPKKTTVGEVMSAAFGGADPSSNKFIAGVAEISDLCEKSIALIEGKGGLPKELRIDSVNVVKAIQSMLAYNHMRSSWQVATGAFSDVATTRLQWVEFYLGAFGRSALQMPLDPEEDTWEPLPIDREAPVYQEVVEALDNVINVVEQDNGYAANEPEERDQMIWSLKEGRDAVAERMPTRDQIESLIIRPLKYLAKKFSDSAIGIAAKEVITKIVELFGWAV